MAEQFKFAHLFQSPDIRISEPQAAQLHIFHTIRSMQNLGHDGSLLALFGNRVLYTSDLSVFHSNSGAETHFGRLGWSGESYFGRVESGIRRVQKEMKLPYFAFFDSYRLYDACLQNLKNTQLIHERFNLLGIGGAIASRRLNIPLVLEVNADLLAQRRFKGRAEKGLRLKYAEWATDFCFSTAKKIICISEQLKDHLHMQWRIPLDKLAVLPCAADVASFNGNFDTAQIKEEIGLTNEFVIVWIGGFYEWHDLPLLIESFDTVLGHFPKTRLLLVGDGPNRPEIEQLVNDKKLINAVIMTGSVPHSKVPELLSIADISVVPSIGVSAGEGGTGTPLKLFEYLAAGKPIVASDLPTAREVICHGHTGYLVEPGNVKAFSGALLKLLMDDGERMKLSQNAYQSALQHHTWENYAENLEEIYECALRAA